MKAASAITAGPNRNFIAIPNAAFDLPHAINLGWSAINKPSNIQNNHNHHLKINKLFNYNTVVFEQNQKAEGQKHDKEELTDTLFRKSVNYM